MLGSAFRRLSVRQRITLIVALLLLPMAGLSIVSVVVLNRQEIAFRDAVEESVHTLLPLSTLEHYLERTLVIELAAESHESMPGFAALTQSIDSNFATVEETHFRSDLPTDEVATAHQAWLAARPLVERLVEQVHSYGPADRTGDTLARKELEETVGHIAHARQQMARAVEARYARAVRERHRQLEWLLWSWIVTLTVAGVLVAFLLKSLLHPIQDLARAAHALGSGARGARAEVAGRDELTALAERFNEMAAYWESTQGSLLNQANADQLTGLLNRRGIHAALEVELINHTNAHQPLAVLMMDLDGFKPINDRYGHGAGDRALVWVSGKLTALLRENDRLGRYGGDEFLAILPGSNKEQAQQVADRMTATIMEASAQEPTLPSISIGVAASPDDGQSANALLEAADGALYVAKRRHAASVIRVMPNR